jgi:hypothetical protein
VRWRRHRRPCFAGCRIYEEIREAFLSGIGAELPAAEFVRVPGPVRAAHVQIEATGVLTVIPAVVIRRCL